MTTKSNRIKRGWRDSEEENEPEQAFEVLKNTDHLWNDVKSIASELEHSVEFISPELARLYLETQKINRTPTNSRVRDYADRMLRGEWKVSQPIQFTSEGDLFDGQHRLLAVIRSGMTCPFLVIRGLPPETRFYVDIGQSRRVSQIAQMMGCGASMNSKLATCKAMFIGRDLKPKNKKAENEAKRLGQANAASLVFSPQKLIELYLKHQEGIDFADQLSAPTSAPVRAVVARAWYHENHVRLQEFVTVVNTGYPITDYDEAAIALRNTLIKAKAEKKSSSDSTQRMVVYQKTSSSLSNFMAKRNIRYVREKEEELYPLADFD